MGGESGREEEGSGRRDGRGVLGGEGVEEREGSPCRGKEEKGGEG